MILSNKEVNSLGVAIPSAIPKMAPQEISSMSLHQLPDSREHAWLFDGEGEQRSPVLAATADAMRWSARRAFQWGGACLATVAGFIVSVVLFLIMTVPELTSYMG
jgi:hypothetical protein